MAGGSAATDGVRVSVLRAASSSYRSPCNSHALAGPTPTHSHPPLFMPVVATLSLPFPLDCFPLPLEAPFPYLLFGLWFVGPSHGCPERVAVPRLDQTPQCFVRILLRPFLKLP